MWSVKIADLDTQQTTCTEWASDRAEAGIKPEIQVQPFGNLNTTLAEAKHFNAYILDGRPHSSRQTIKIARVAHLIVIPTGQTKDDLRPAAVDEHERLAFALVDEVHSMSCRGGEELALSTDWAMAWACSAGSGWASSWASMASAGSMRTSTARITPSSPASPRAGRHLHRLGHRPHVPNERLRHMLIGHVYHANGVPRRLSCRRRTCP